MFARRSNKIEIMSKENEIENPQAFPKTTTTLINCGSELRSEENKGMTLRDYFAAKTMMSHSTQKPKNIYHWFKWFFGFTYKSAGVSPEDNAKNAYANADAMLKERSKIENYESI